MDITLGSGSNKISFIYCAPLYFQNLKALCCHNTTNINKYINLYVTFEFLYRILIIISLPLGIVCGPQENSLLYRIFYKEIQMLRKDALIFQLRVLSDEGKGLIKFCTDNVIMTFN